MENKFFISSFKEAAKNTMFQHRWMPVETWAALINHYYKPPVTLVCDGTKLLNAVTRNKWFNTAIETTGVIDDELSLYRNRHRPKGGKQIYCFYAASKGVKPTIKEKQWHNYIDYAYDLLNKKITRSETLYLSEGTKELAQKKSPDVAQKRLRPQTNSESNLLSTDESNCKQMRITSEAASSSLALPSTVLPSEDIYWTSTEARLLFMPTIDEADSKEAIDNQIFYCWKKR
jgi:hypothetical protein